MSKDKSTIITLIKTHTAQKAPAKNAADYLPTVMIELGI